MMFGGSFGINTHIDLLRSNTIPPIIGRRVYVIQEEPKTRNIIALGSF